MRKPWVSKKICSVENCGKPVHGRTFCDKHYQRFKFHGDPLKTITNIGQPTLTKNGYLVRRINRKTALVHRLIMEEYIGRKLFPSEVVHHINGIRTDNRIENMEITTNAQHSSFHHPKGMNAIGGKPRNRRCSIAECGKAHFAMGFCSMHYSRFLRYGDPFFSKYKRNPRPV